ncbi:hypothetical protein [Spirilliplanes yamanashiensis]|uniref:Uncharacterized protein n=1 Tax=Spirilliplanes yamanashiensis TaxID=42233 RepID=A0A8J4DH08_9ACTN|nr:hypothetical protein [Spirilliplanes yamanashiensis]MDP9820162.1 hypothetical protein [Spirilliplanes yamanashiensis]GIJ01018.1 hypothetical protein Sya03_03700 [Spirilliplanes yamanashiensis]
MTDDIAPPPAAPDRRFGRLLAAGLAAVVAGGACAMGAALAGRSEVRVTSVDPYIARQERFMAALPPRIDLRVGPHAPGSTPTEATARDLVRRYDCRHLGWDAAEQTLVQSDVDRYLLTVQELQLVHDGRADYRFPVAGGPDPVLLTCRGTGVWGDGTDLNPMTFHLKVTAGYEVYTEYTLD